MIKTVVVIEPPLPKVTGASSITQDMPMTSKRQNGGVRNSKDKHSRESVKKSLKKSKELWIPLSDTPEPMERSVTRILERSTDGLEVPTVSDEEMETDPLTPRWVIMDQLSHISSGGCTLKSAQRSRAAWAPNHATQPSVAGPV